MKTGRDGFDPSTAVDCDRRGLVGTGCGRDVPAPAATGKKTGINGFDPSVAVDCQRHEPANARNWAGSRVAPGMGRKGEEMGLIGQNSGMIFPFRPRRETPPAEVRSF